MREADPQAGGGNIPIENIYHMLCYAFNCLDRTELRHLSAEPAVNIFSLLALMLSTGTSRQLRQGLFRSYVDRTDDLPLIRGRIDMSGTIRNAAAGRRQVTCEFAELSEDSLPSRILKTAMLALVREPKVDGQLKAALRKDLQYFSAVGTVNPSAVPWSSLQFDRSTRNWRMLMGVSRLVLESLLMTEQEGPRLLEAGVRRNLPRLYEKFLLEFYRQECAPALRSSASQIPWGLDGGTAAFLPVMQTDITLTSRDPRVRRVLIIDAKFYSHTLQHSWGTATVHSQNLYQIFTYVKNREWELRSVPHEVSGMLLYARTDEAVQPDVTYRMSGSRIAVRTLDLSQKFDRIRAALLAIAEEFFPPLP